MDAPKTTPTPIVEAGEAWPNALMLAADLIDQRGFSPRYLQHPDTGALALDTALKLALGYTWVMATGQDEEDEPVRVLTAPSKAVSKLHARLERALTVEVSRVFLEANPTSKLPGIGWWNTQVSDPELPALVLRRAGAQFEADRARILRFKTRPPGSAASS